MKALFSGTMLILVVLCDYSFEASAAESQSCMKYVVQFQGSVKSVPPFIYYGSVKIGQVDLVKDQGSTPQNMSICIDKNHSGAIEKHTVCYVSNDQVVIYNVWSTGVDLKEGESIKGFTSRFELYVYEAKELFVLVRDASLAFVLELVGKFAGEDSVVKAKKVYEVLAK